ncbi:MAG: LicD family protein [Clostridiaceae bacterium]|nr:LicD family protein [Clostridiaceae bacterium]
MKVNSEQLKEIQLEILNEVHSFCEKNEIKYYLTYGTLLGAIRHKGYIPWDDDIDICMPRPDYEKFAKSFNKNQSRYKFVSYEIDKKFLYRYGKVMDTTTRVIEDARINYELGINIDIFPIDGINDDLSLLKKQIMLRRFIDFKVVKISKRNSFVNNLVLFIGRIIVSPVTVGFLVNKMITNAKSYSYEEAQKVCCVVMGTKLNKPVPKEYFAERKLVDFENFKFYVPIGYDAYLRSVFGDYMKLPPEDKRATHHLFTAYIKEEK